MFDLPTTADAQSVDHIFEAGRHLLRLINEVLDISRIEAGRHELSPEPVPLLRRRREALDLVRRSRPSARSTLRDDMHGASAARRPQRLKQVLLNLLRTRSSTTAPAAGAELTVADELGRAGACA